MCTSFIHRKSEVFIAMNFDNNGMPFSIDTKDHSRFTVLVDGGRGKHPSFGVNSRGVFCNNLIVDSNGKGLYKRAGKKVTHTSKLTEDILSGCIPSDGIGDYLKMIEVVNGPGFSVHNMIVNAEGDIWVVEPGRGVIYSPVNESPYYVMTNFSLCDYGGQGTPKGDGADRYITASALLSECDEMNVDSAFQVLGAAKQDEGDWRTALSVVYSQKERAVYYCFDGNFTNVSQFLLV